MAVGDIQNLKTAFNPSTGNWELSWSTEGLDTEKKLFSDGAPFDSFEITISTGWPGADLNNMTHRLGLIRRTKDVYAGTGYTFRHTDKMKCSDNGRFEVRITVQAKRVVTTAEGAIPEGAAGVYDEIYTTPRMPDDLTIVNDPGTDTNPPDVGQVIVTWTPSTDPAAKDAIHIFPAISVTHDDGTVGMEMNNSSALCIESIEYPKAGEANIKLYEAGTYYAVLSRRVGVLSEQSATKSFTIGDLTPVFPKKPTGEIVDCIAEYSTDGTSLIVRWPAIKTKVDSYILRTKAQEWKKPFATDVRTVKPDGKTAYHEVTLENIFKITPDSALGLRVTATREFKAADNMNYLYGRVFTSKGISPVVYKESIATSDGKVAHSKGSFATIAEAANV